MLSAQDVNHIGMLLQHELLRRKIHTIMARPSAEAEFAHIWQEASNAVRDRLKAALHPYDYQAIDGAIDWTFDPNWTFGYTDEKEGMTND